MAQEPALSLCLTAGSIGESNCIHCQIKPPYEFQKIVGADFPFAVCIVQQTIGDHGDDSACRIQLLLLR